MGIEIFEHEKSDRAARLWGVIKPYVKAGTTILDIGCGNAPLAHYAVKDAPGVEYTGFDNHGEAVNDLKRRYPLGRWTRENYPVQFNKALLRPYDIVVHIGVDKEEFSPICRIHADILNAGHRPGIALLECGIAEEYQGPAEACLKALALYLNTGDYELADSGFFFFDVAGHHLRERRWYLVRKKP